GTGGGSVIREDVPPGALAVSAGPQRNIPDWAVKNRPGTAQAEAAASTSHDVPPASTASESE
ncbi:MAG TPA: bifunctional UDP-N-acetylglucosamine diphosphorylase/glucosamine-1-phosphate N-acetyltransferase GlmU, partial [Marmoricola sp.]|nr:bifunctional UDP-N-acetylglucosamine diphosphorylase/glucosamine-1-phosphate N-acetyltransferase GlmU [Marmoricola sp.]